MSAVVATADGEEKNVETENVGKVECNGDRAAFAGVVGLLAVDGDSRLVGCAVRVVLMSDG